MEKMIGGNTMENPEMNIPWQSPAPQEPPLPAGKKEFLFGICAAVCGYLLCNFTFFGGFGLAFAVLVIACLAGTGVYLIRSGCQMNGYSAALLALCFVIAAGFGRSDDGLVKFVMTLFLLVAGDLALCHLAGRNRFRAGGFLSLLDAPMSFLFNGIGPLPQALRGIANTLKNGGRAVRRFGAIGVGLMVAVPVLLMLIPLLMSADAAFNGLVQLLPELDLSQLIITAIFGTGITSLIYTRGVALRHKTTDMPELAMGKISVSHLTVNTVLVVVDVVYLMYLLSQLAYFVGGFSGILPEDYTMAQYARQGFFEMAYLCVINLGIIAMAVGLVRKKDGEAPLSTRLLCLFIGMVTVFLVCAASAKMFLYIGGYGLTRLRVLTEVVMLFLCAATMVVCLWLFLPKLQYMKFVVILALAMGAAVLWVDVDTVVAGYNVSAYQSGTLDSIDLDYLDDLGDGAIPAIARLLEDADPQVAQRAREIIRTPKIRWQDFRDWNWASWRAEQIAREEWP